MERGYVFHEDDSIESTSSSSKISMTESEESDQLNPMIHWRVPNCAICQDCVRVPVRFLCFDCPKSVGRPHCHTFSRVCLVCAQQYLELCVPTQQRSSTKRCITCPSYTNPVYLHEDTAYEIDFWILHHDHYDKYTCFHHDKGCDFIGTQDELYRHIRQTCLQRLVMCDLCHEYYVMSKKDRHDAECVCQTTCPRCDCRVATERMDEHMHLVHEQLQCKRCLEWIRECDWRQHETNMCPFRRVHCPICLQAIEVIHFISHIAQEEIDVMSKMNDAMNTIRQTTSKLQNIVQIKLQFVQQYSTS